MKIVRLGKIASKKEVNRMIRSKYGGSCGFSLGLVRCCHGYSRARIRVVGAVESVLWGADLRPNLNHPLPVQYWYEVEGITRES